jgi:hypothetical protein
MSGKLNSISAKDISAAVRKAVDKNTALKATKAIEPTVATIRPPIWGFILREAEAKAMALGELNKLAGEVAGSLGAGNAKAAAFSHGGHIIIGYVEEPSITVLKE